MRPAVAPDNGGPVAFGRSFGTLRRLKIESLGRWASRRQTAAPIPPCFARPAPTRKQTAVEPFTLLPYGRPPLDF
jgi:hypothetical protein